MKYCNTLINRRNILICVIFFMSVTLVFSATVFRENFDSYKEGQSLAGEIPQVGDSWTVEEGAFERQIVQSDVSRSGKALKLTRIKGEKQALRGESDPRTARLTPGCTMLLKADFYRSDDAQAARLMLTPMGQSGFKPCIWVKANGNFFVWSSKNGSEWIGSWVDTGIKAGSGVWCTLEIVTKWENESKPRLAGTYDAFVTRHVPGKESQRTCIAKDIPTPIWSKNAWVEFSIENYDYQQEDTSSETFWDNIELQVEPGTDKPVAKDKTRKVQ